MATDDRGRKPRGYYVDYSKKNDRFKDRRRGQTNVSNNSRYKETPDISFGHRGFLITSVDEVKSYLEMRNIFEGYCEELYFAKNTDKSGNSGGAGDNANTTTEDDLEKELQQLRRNRPFKQVKTHCRNTLFLNIMNEFSHISPVTLVDKFFDELKEKREIKTTNTFKVLPILDTFRISTACAKESVSNLLQNIFKDDTGPKTYFIEFQSRGNYKLNPEDKQKMIEGIADTVSDLRPEWTVGRDNADYIIVLVALKSVCCIAFLQNYFGRSKYNVIEFCKDFAPADKIEESTNEPVQFDEQQSPILEK